MLGADSLLLKSSAATPLAALVPATPAHKPAVVEFGAQYISDVSRNFDGGMCKGHGQMGLIDLTALLSSDSAGLFPGGELMVHAEHTHGATLTGTYVGDFQTFSNIESTPATYLYQLWYRQTIGRASLLVGRHDLNSEFMITDYGLLFVNSAFGVISSGSLNVPLSIFPRTGLAAVATVEITPRLLLKAGIYDGDPGDFETDPYGLSMRISADEGALAISELHYGTSINGKLNGMVKLGGYYHTGKFEQYTDTTGTLQQGNWGVYMHIDQQLIVRPGGDDHGLGAFAQLSFAPAALNMNDWYCGVGLHYTGVFPGRDDILGIGYAIMHASQPWRSLSASPLLSCESAVELTFREPLGEHFIVQPDIQYIIHPGLSKTTKNAVAGTLRCIIIF